MKRATPRSNEMATNNRRAPGQQYDSNPRQQRYGNDNAGYGGNTADSTATMNTNPMASMMTNPMFATAFSNQQFDPNAMANFFQQQGGMFNPMMFQQMMMGAMGAGTMGGMSGAGPGLSQQQSSQYGAQSRHFDQDHNEGRSSAYNNGPARPSEDSPRGGGRDYQRERSPDRRGSAAGGGGSRW